MTNDVIKIQISNIVRLLNSMNFKFKQINKENKMELSCMYLERRRR